MTYTIAVIEDNEDVRNNLSEILDAEGYQVHSAEDGDLGIKLINRIKPDLILCDIMMPKVDGYGVLEAVRNTTSISDTPFLFLTAKTSKEDLNRGMELGADDYIMKPFTIDQLLNRVVTRLNKRAEVLKKFESAGTSDSSAIPLGDRVSEPLKSINTMSDLIMREHYNMEKEELVEFCTLIHRSGLELKEILTKASNYLSMEQLQRNPERLAELKHESCSTVPVVEEVAKKVAERMKRSEDLLTSIDPVAILFPEFYLKQVLEEVIDNAFRYSNFGKLVKVSSAIQGDLVELKVADEGIGMSEANMERVQRGVEKDNLKMGAVSLGLPNVKSLLRLFDAEISIHAQAGIGTQIKLIFKKS